MTSSHEVDGADGIRDAWWSREVAGVPTGVDDGGGVE